MTQEHVNTFTFVLPYDGPAQVEYSFVRGIPDTVEIIDVSIDGHQICLTGLMLAQVEIAALNHAQLGRTTVPAVTHIMLDLETWGTTPGSDIRSIGAIVFDPVAGTLGDEIYRATPHGERHGLTRDPATIEWWGKQSQESQQALAGDYTLLQALQDFARFVGRRSASPEAVRIWAHGSTFDVPILDHAFRAVGLPAPWHYRSPRDTRTMFEAAGGIVVPSTGVLHDALDDARNQAVAVIGAYRKLGLAATAALTFEQQFLRHVATSLHTPFDVLMRDHQANCAPGPSPCAHSDDGTLPENIDAAALQIGDRSTW